MPISAKIAPKKEIKSNGLSTFAANAKHSAKKGTASRTDWISTGE